MEMNTRLQVEHPVTEEITGVDLVEWQLRVASGEPVPLRQEELSINGWAMEARLYAEDPAKGFLPSTGRLEDFFIPSMNARIDTGVEEGSDVSPFYDPMIAKIIVHRPTRRAAIEALADELEGTLVYPVKSNAGFLWGCLRDRDFQSGALDTGLIARKDEELMPSARPSDVAVDIAASARILRYERENDYFPEHLSRSMTGFRLNSKQRTQVTFQAPDGNMLMGTAHDVARMRQFQVLTRSRTDGELIVEHGQTYLLKTRSDAGGGHHAHDGDIVAPMPGKVIAVDVAQGQAVTAGQRLLVLEAMKMEHALTAPFDGTVVELNTSEGAQVQVEALLARVEAHEG
jgi:3-methylcrotonyl-CoA carboxylase alpha subunit